MGKFLLHHYAAAAYWPCSWLLIIAVDGMRRYARHHYQTPLPAPLDLAGRCPATCWTRLATATAVLGAVACLELAFIFRRENENQERGWLGVVQLVTVVLQAAYVGTLWVELAAASAGAADKIYEVRGHKRAVCNSGPEVGLLDGVGAVW